jgi:hypothetical protein
LLIELDPLLERPLDAAAELEVPVAEYMIFASFLSGHVFVKL